jgi:hypothetical protein
LAPPFGGGSFAKIDLFQTFVFLFPVSDVPPDQLFLLTDRRNKVPSGPKVLTHEVAPLLPVHPRQMDRALSLSVPDLL